MSFGFVFFKTNSWYSVSIFCMWVCVCVHVHVCVMSSYFVVYVTVHMKYVLLWKFLLLWTVCVHMYVCCSGAVFMYNLRRRVNITYIQKSSLFHSLISFGRLPALAAHSHYVFALYNSLSCVCVCIFFHTYVFVASFNVESKANMIHLFTQTCSCFEIIIIIE